MISPGLLNTGEAVARINISVDLLGTISHELATVHDARLADLFGEVTDNESLMLRVVYAFDRVGRYVVVEAEFDGERYPSLSDFDPAAFVEECELYEQFGVTPENDKRLNRLLAPPHQGDRVVAGARQERTRSKRKYEPHVVSGEAFEFPFGPVRAAGWESLYMGLVTTGEEVLDLYLMPWHKRRGLERLLVGRDPDRASFLVERVEGLCAVGNTLAFSRAVETATGLEVPGAVQRTRCLALELERIYNHVAAIAATCQATGLSVGQARVELVLEQLLRLNAAVFGHRYLFGVICPGGVLRDANTTDLQPTLAAILAELRGVIDGLLHTNSYMDRLEATGIVTPEKAKALSLVGPVARAAGQDLDVRRDHPTSRDEAGPGRVPVGEEGDALARIRVMVQEIQEAAALVDSHSSRTGAGRLEIPAISGEGLGWAETPRGETLVWVALDDQGRVRFARVRPGSARNWRAFDDAARARNVFTDIPIIEASFWLTVAGYAR